MLGSLTLIYIELVEPCLETVLIKIEKFAKSLYFECDSFDIQHVPLRFFPWKSKIGFWSLIFRCKIYLWSFTIFIFIYLRKQNLFPIVRDSETAAENLQCSSKLEPLMLNHPAVEQVDWSQFTIKIIDKFFRIGLRPGLSYTDCFYSIVNYQALIQLLKIKKSFMWTILYIWRINMRFIWYGVLWCEKVETQQCINAFGEVLNSQNMIHLVKIHKFSLRSPP